MNKYGAKKTTCGLGHSHDSRREAVRCIELHLLQRNGEISDLKVHPKFKFEVNGDWLKLRNGQIAGYTADFQYIENGKLIVEDIKGMIVRDFPLRSALFRHLNPDIELRITK